MANLFIKCPECGTTHFNKILSTDRGLRLITFFEIRNRLLSLIMIANLSLRGIGGKLLRLSIFWFNFSQIILKDDSSSKMSLGIMDKK